MKLMGNLGIPCWTPYERNIKLTFQIAQISGTLKVTLLKFAVHIPLSKNNLSFF